MKQTRLYQTHLELGGRMVDFAGWALPVQYPTGPLQEHGAVREAVGLFDIDHMGQVRVEGSDAELFLQYVTTRDVSPIETGRATYSLLCYSDGTIVDDIFIYRRSDHWFVVVNASNREKDVAWLQHHAHDFDVSIVDVSDETYMLALQGPKAQTVLQSLTPSDLDQLPYHAAVETTVADTPCLVGATGYTGEYGYELFFPAERAEHVWNALMEAGQPHGLLPCGLGARDSLRFEACLALYGHEIDAHTDPISARLGWTLAWAKGSFIGREALLKVRLEGPPKLLVGLEMVDRGVPRQGHQIVHEGQSVGEVTTGMKAPTLGKFLALGYVRPDLTNIGAEVEVIIHDRPRRAQVVKRPFYTPAYRRKQ